MVSHRWTSIRFLKLVLSVFRMSSGSFIALKAMVEGEKGGDGMGGGEGRGWELEKR